MKPYQTLNRLDISSSVLERNLTYFQELNPQAAIAPVLKSNAYGHGLVLIAKWLDQYYKLPYLCVDSLYEAYELYKAKISTPILIIGYTDPRNFAVWKKLPFTFPAFDETTLASLNHYQPGAKIHLKIDTGMNRLGLYPHQIPDFIKLLKQYPKVKIEGIYSHLSQVNDQAQIKAFKSAIYQFEHAGFSFKWKHLAATAGALSIKDPEFNLIRLGLGFYNNALTFITHLIQVKRVGKGSAISYDGTFVTSKPTTIGILPLGYADGLDRRLSNIGSILVKNKPCRILGRVCMNLTIIDLSSVPQSRVGDEVIIFGPTHSLENLSKLCKTIPYDLLVHLTPTTRRVIIE